MDVAIIGGGIQGVCAALALAQAGSRVTIFEGDDALLDRTSFRSEGKIHLGFVYANDATGRTSELMLEAAMHFGPLLERWIGPVHWDGLRSDPFRYVRLPASLLSIDELLAHYARVERNYGERWREAGLHYLGTLPETLVREPRERSPRWLTQGMVVAETAEVAVDRPKFRELMRRAVEARQGIEVRTGHRVEEVERTGGGFRIVASDAAGRQTSTQWDVVVNCAWGGRLRIDRQVGLEPGRRWIYRLKHRLTGRLDPLVALPSCTFVLGPFGDFVRYPGDAVYLSWYPVGLEKSDELAPPTAWDRACRSRLSTEEQRQIESEVLGSFREIVPALGGVRVDDVGGGVIFAWGSRDIDDPTSELHQRSEIGVEELDGYYSINTGKFTCAPLFASQLTERIRTSFDLA